MRRRRTPEDREKWLSQLGQVVIEQKERVREISISGIWLLKQNNQNSNKPAEAKSAMLYTDMPGTTEQIDRDLVTALFNFIVNHIKSGHLVVVNKPINPRTLEM